MFFSNILIKDFCAHLNCPEQVKGKFPMMDLRYYDDTVYFTCSTCGAQIGHLWVGKRENVSLMFKKIPLEKLKESDRVDGVPRDLVGTKVYNRILESD